MNIENLGSQPIPGPNPAGQDARYDVEYEQLQAEIDKLNSVTKVEEVDWKRVVDLSGNILERKAKDLLAAAYMSVGLTQTRGLEGLVLGMRILKEMTTTFWEDCFPPKKRLRGRINAFSWWQEKTLIWLKNHLDPTPLPVQLRQDLLAHAAALDQSLEELLPDLPPLRELINILERLPVEAPEPEPNAPGMCSVPSQFTVLTLG